MRRPLMWLALVLGVLGLQLIGASVAGAHDAGADLRRQAEDEEATTVRGNLINKQGTRERQDDEPVEGVVIVAEDESGAQVGEATSDAEGKWEIVLPGAGTFSVTLDEDSLPDDVELAERATTTFSVNPGDAQLQIFDLGARTRETTTQFDKFLQLLFSGVRFGLIIAITSVGLSLIFGTTGLTNFAHGEMVTIGGVIAWYANVAWGMPFILAAIVSIVGGVITAWLMDLGIWRPLRHRGVSLLAMMVVSIGLSIVLRYGIQFIFKASPRVYADYQGQSPIEWGPVNMAPRDLWTIGISLVVVVLVALLLEKTRIGKAMRAVSDNRDLAAASGIDVDRVILFVWGLGGGLAALGGVLFALNERIAFNSGFSLLLLMFAGITLGGLGTAYGALLGSFIVGVFIQVSTLWVSPELKNVGALVVLILVLIVRPQGILGKAERVG